MDEESSCPGLKAYPRKKGPPALVWVADEKLVKKGYAPKTVNLSSLRDSPKLLSAKCRNLSAEMRAWAAGIRPETGVFDGTIGSLLDAYETHPRSTLLTRRPGTQVTYGKYIKMLRTRHGDQAINAITAADLLDWRDEWIAPKKGRPPKLAVAVTARAILMAAATFGISMRMPGTKDFYEVLKATEFEKPASRTQVLTVAQITAAREQAHRAGRPRRALAYAITFETGLRLSDVVGLWLPMDAAGVSDVIDGRMKWVGLRFDDMTGGRLTYTPSKTLSKTAKAVAIDLAQCPMVIEELEHVPLEQRHGPVIINEKTGKPYLERDFREYGWHRDFKHAGIPKGIWARDIRASASTEARAAGASVDDTTQFLGKTDRRGTATVYDRATFEAAQRVQTARLKARNAAET